MEQLDIGDYCYADDLEKINVNFFDDFKPLDINDNMIQKIKKYSRENQNSLFMNVINKL